MDVNVLLEKIILTSVKLWLQLLMLKVWPWPYP